GMASANRTQMAWTVADQPTATGSYTPDSTHSYNSTGGAISVIPSSDHVGVYDVHFSGFDESSGNFYVTPYGSSNYCWVAIGGFYTATVHCFDPSGNPAYTKFAALYQVRKVKNPETNHAVGFILGGLSGYIFTYYTYNSTGKSIQIMHNNTGNYTVSFDG